MTAERNVRLFTFEWKGRKSFYHFSTKNKTQPGTWWVDLSALRLVFMYTRMSKQLLICNLFFLKILFFYFCTNKQSIKIYFVQIIRNIKRNSFSMESRLTSQQEEGVRQLFTVLYATFQLICMYFHEWRNKMLLTTILLFHLMTFSFFSPYSYLLLWNTIFQLTRTALKKCITRLFYAYKVFPNSCLLISTSGVLRLRFTP